MLRNKLGDLFAQTLIFWQREHGRHDLPWQQTSDPYRVWLSEIMLQQTQVVTVKGYFDKFLSHYPDVASLARASVDDVLGLWSGLGYYSRARNLHRCAQQVVQLHSGVFPSSAKQLQTLPGIGPSTAAAIASICFGERVAILDGNVKRVLTRYLGFDADIAVLANERRLLQEANRLLPLAQLQTNMPTYTQAVMDLGATVCTAKKPACQSCPLQWQCHAQLLATPEKFPVKTRKLKRTSQSIWMLWAIRTDGAVLLSQRPVPGVWGGLYCFELFESLMALQAFLPSETHGQMHELPVIKHALTHKDLYLHPVKVILPANGQFQADGSIWLRSDQWSTLGLPAPIRKLLTP